MRAAWDPWAVERAAGELPEIVAPMRNLDPPPYIWATGNLRPPRAHGIINVSARDAIGPYPAVDMLAILRLGPRH